MAGGALPFWGNHSPEAMDFYICGIGRHEGCMRSCPQYENTPAPGEPGTFFQEIDKAPAPGLKHVILTLYLPTEDTFEGTHQIRQVVAEPIILWNDFTFTYGSKAKLVSVNDPKIMTAYIEGNFAN
jgi:hypothetical protein